ncbi:TrmB family transcriptional regulator [bacterium]|nr:TrmB family transcriptional regulator [bacterium]
MKNNKLTKHLLKFGFSSYEARAYISLLQSNPVSGYELANNSQIPPSKIYEVIKKLMERSMISPVEGKPIKYIPQDSKIFLGNLRDTYNNTLKYLEHNLPETKQNESNYVWNIMNRDEFINKAEELINHATNEIAILGWDQDIKDILNVLEKKKKKIKIAIVQYGIMEIAFGTVYRHRIQNVIKEEKGGREFTAVSDNSTLIHGLISSTGEVSGIWTSHSSMVQIAMDYIKHEIYSTKIFNKFEKILFKEFGSNLEKLRNIWEQ